MTPLLLIDVTPSASNTLKFLTLEIDVFMEIHAAQFLQDLINTFQCSFGKVEQLKFVFVLGELAYFAEKMWRELENALLAPSFSLLSRIKVEVNVQINRPQNQREALMTELRMLPTTYLRRVASTSSFQFEFSLLSTSSFEAMDW